MSNYNSVPGGQGENICIPGVRKLCKPNEGWVYLLWAIGTNKSLRGTYTVQPPQEVRND